MVLSFWLRMLDPKPYALNPEPRSQTPNLEALDCIGVWGPDHSEADASGNTLHEPYTLEIHPPIPKIYSHQIAPSCLHLPWEIRDPHGLSTKLSAPLGLSFKFEVYGT